MKHRTLTLLVMAAGCGDSQTGQAPPWAAGPGATPPTAGAPAAASAGGVPRGSQAPIAGQATAGPESVHASLLRDLKLRKFKNEDFLESDGNRDPFHCYLSDFNVGPTIDRQYALLFPKYSLDELKLAMVVSPHGAGTRSIAEPPKGADDSHPRCDLVPCAMFIDPNGDGKAVARGFHMSKADAKVIRIEPEKGQVVVELKEDVGNGKFRSIERVLSVNSLTEGTNP